jgi:hypothetical protein
MTQSKAETYKLSLSGKGIKIDQDISAEVAQRIVVLAMGVPIGTSGVTLTNEAQGGTLPSHGVNSSPKSFLASKRPTTDVERITVLAYYLDRQRGTPAFKTIDLTKLNTEAAGRNFSNATYSARNAVALGYLTSAGSGKKQITARGEALVEALPAREAVKAALEANPIHRRRQKANKAKSKK